MYNNQKVLGLICARGGSIGLPNKNILPLGGIPMIAHAICKLRSIPAVDKVIVSSDSHEILETAAKYGAETPFVRPASLALANTPLFSVVLHAIETLKPEIFDYLLLAQANSPHSRAEDMFSALSKTINEERDVVFSVTECPHPPQWSLAIENNTPKFAFPEYAGTNQVRRQDTETLYRSTGEFSCAKIEYLLSTKNAQLYLPCAGQNSGIIITDFVSSIDIDSLNDYKIAQAILG